MFTRKIMTSFKRSSTFWMSLHGSIKTFSKSRKFHSSFKVSKCSESNLKSSNIQSKVFSVKREMKVLELNRTFLVLLGVCPAPNSKWSTIFKLNYILMLVLQILGLISSIWFIAKFIRIDLNSVLYAGFHTSAYSSSTYSLLVGFVVKHKIMKAFTKLQTICDESK